MRTSVRVRNSRCVPGRTRRAVLLRVTWGRCWVEASIRRRLWCPWHMSSSDPGPTAVGLPARVSACLFDLDGVLTDTASVHAAAWKEMFDGYLRERADRLGEAFVPFDIAHDYPAYVDGKRRQDGTRSFLASRNIELPEGTPDDAADAETINGLGTRKNNLVHVKIAKDGVTVYPGSVRYLEAVKAA